MNSSPSELQVARMSSADLEAVGELSSITQSSVDLASEQSKEYSHIWVARRTSDARAVAYALIWMVADELQIIDLATHPSWRRRGAARALVLHLITFARQRAMRCLLLEARTTNVAALALYGSVGFTTLRVRPRYYSDGENACEMELSLTP